MILSRFNISTKDGQGQTLLYNTLNEAFVELTPEYAATYELLRAGSSVPELDREHIDDFSEQGFLVSNLADEECQVANWMRNISYQNDGTYRATIVTTMACNLACTYCVENGAKTGTTMSEETADQTFTWITEQAEASHTRYLSIGYYGGEPLLNMDVVVNLSERFQKWCKINHMGFGFTLSTNGTLFTPEVVDRLLPLGLRLAQISIDGLADLHDQRRPFKSGTGSSFKTAMANLTVAVERLPINLVGTYTVGEEEEVITFLDHLVKSGLSKQLASIQFEPESAYCDEDSNGCHSAGACACDTTQSIEKRTTLVRAMLERGIRLDKPLIGPSACAIAMEHGHVVVAPDGALYKCNPLVGHREFAVGHIEDSGLASEHHQNMAREPWKQCLEQTDCPFVYTCGITSGCRFQALLREGDLWATGCRRTFLEEAMPELMRLEHFRLEKSSQIE